MSSPNALARLVVATVALLVLLGAVSSDAQIGRVNDQNILSGTNTSNDPSILRVGNTFNFVIPGTRVPAALIGGVLFPPEAEPTGIDNHRAKWTYCQATGPKWHCQDKINLFGTAAVANDFTVTVQAQ